MARTLWKRVVRNGRLLTQESFWHLKTRGFGGLIRLCFLFCYSHTFTHHLEQNTYKEKAYWHHTHTHTNTHTPKDYFQVKIYIHDCYVQLQYAALGVMDHCNAFYHILGLEFGKYHISSCTESCPMVPYPFGQSVFYHCRTYSTFML